MSDIAEGRERVTAILFFFPTWAILSHRCFSWMLDDDYAQADQEAMALRSRLTSCFWRAGQMDQGRALLDSLVQDHPQQRAQIRQIIAELEGNDISAEG